MLAKLPRRLGRYGSDWLSIAAPDVASGEAAWTTIVDLLLDNGFDEDRLRGHDTSMQSCSLR